MKFTYLDGHSENCRVGSKVHGMRRGAGHPMEVTLTTAELEYLMRNPEYALERVLFNMQKDPGPRC